MAVMALTCTRNYVIYMAYVIVTITIATGLTSQRNYAGSQILRVDIPSVEKWSLFQDTLSDTSPSGRNAIIDMWRPPVHNGTADVHVNCDDVTTARMLLDKMGLTHHVIVEDVQRLINRESASNNHRRRRSTDTSNVIGHYARYQEIEAWMSDMSILHPSIVKIIDIGRTAEGRRMNVLKLGVEGDNKWKVWMDGGIHAREWIAPSTVLYIANQLIRGYLDKDSSTKEFLHKVDWYFLPSANPDGYEYSHTNDRLWRKNRKLDNLTGCHGVDLNRNWRFQWGGAYSSKDPCDNVYQGKAPEDELEVQNIVRFLEPRAHAFIAFLTFHSYGQRFITRWDYTKEIVPNDHDQLMSLAEKAVKVMQHVHGTVYEAGRAPELMYPYGGGSPDWARAIANIKYSYLIELRDKHSFILPVEEIIPTGEENWAALRVIAREILQYYGDIRAPHVNDPPSLSRDNHVTNNNNNHVLYKSYRKQDHKISVVFHRSSGKNIHTGNVILLLTLYFFTRFSS